LLHAAAELRHETGIRAMPALRVQRVVARLSRVFRTRPRRGFPDLHFARRATRARRSRRPRNGGRWIPTTSLAQYDATLCRWFGIAESDLSYIFPDTGAFANTNLGFMIWRREAFRARIQRLYGDRSRLARTSAWPTWRSRASPSRSSNRFRTSLSAPIELTTPR
jgi:hypothetical protein